MLGIYVSVPIACFRKGVAREFLETERVPPPATCYGFLLSMVGETNRRRHIGSRVSPVLVSNPSQSVVLRTVWRVKKTPLGSPGNTRPDYQQLLSGIEVVIWIDSRDEHESGDSLEQRVRRALDPLQRHTVTRFGGLSLGESTHLVDVVKPLEPDEQRDGEVYLIAPRGRLTLPVWVDHVGSGETRYVTGDLMRRPLTEPPLDQMPLIEPHSQ